MIVYGGANCHAFGDKHLFYVLFVRPTFSHVDGGSTLSADGVGLVPIMLPGYLKLHSLNPAYWNPTYQKKPLSLSALKLYGGFRGAYHETLSSYTFRDSQG